MGESMRIFNLKILKGKSHLLNFTKSLLVTSKEVAPVRLNSVLKKSKSNCAWSFSKILPMIFGGRNSSSLVGFAMAVVVAFAR